MVYRIDQRATNAVDAKLDTASVNAACVSLLVSWLATRHWQPGSSTPGSSTPGSSTPGSSTPGSSTPGSSTPVAYPLPDTIPYEQRCQIATQPVIRRSRELKILEQTERLETNHLKRLEQSQPTITLLSKREQRLLRYLEQQCNRRPQSSKGVQYNV